MLYVIIVPQIFSGYLVAIKYKSVMINSSVAGSPVISSPITNSPIVVAMDFLLPVNDDSTQLVSK